MNCVRLRLFYLLVLNLYKINNLYMGRVGIEPTTNALKGRCSTG
jgi:hypothetical protein